jgi:hypothetical protein
MEIKLTDLSRRVEMHEVDAQFGPPRPTPEVKPIYELCDPGQEWHDLKLQMLAGDELWEYSVGGHGFYRAGFAVKRGEEVVGHITLITGFTSVTRDEAKREAASDKERSSRIPLIAAVLLLVPVLYVGSYLALVTPGGYKVNRRAAPVLFFSPSYYRCCEPVCATLFWPLEKCHRKLRPGAWAIPDESMQKEKANVEATFTPPRPSM